VLLCLICGVTVWTTRGSRDTKGNPPAGQGGTRLLAVDRQALNIGERWEGSRISYTLPFRNTLNETVRIDQFRVSCDCTSTTSTPLHVAPNATASVHFDIDLSRASGVDGDSSRPFSVQLLPVLHGQMPQMPWILSGTVKQAIVPSTRSLNLGELRLGVASEVQMLSATVAPGFDLTAKCLDAQDTVSVTRRDGNVFDIQFELGARTMPGRCESSFDLIATNTRDDETATCRIPITSIVYGPFRITPNALHFGDVPLSNEKQVTLSVQSRDGKAALVSGIRTSDDARFDAKLLETRAASSPNVVTSITIGITSRGVGLIAGTIIVEMKASDPYARLIPVPVSFMCTGQ
jgi:Protein of unknown function (DUF1573)